MIYIPLFNFTSKTVSFEFNQYTILKKIENYDNLISFMDKEFYSKREIESVYQCSHFLEINDSHSQIVNFPNLSKKIEDIYLVACWIYKPLRIHMKFTFGQGISSFDPNLIEPYTFRILHRKRRNEYEESTIRIELDDLIKIKEYFNKLITLYHTPSRLQLTSTLTFWGMISMTWIEAYITFTNTFEILLTHKRNLGIKRKLALTCACILEESDIKRNIILEEFCSLYKFRCDIVHGKTEAILEDIGYKYLSRISKLLRLTLSRILENDNLITQLNGSDSERKQLIQDIQGDYNPDFSFLNN